MVRYALSIGDGYSMATDTNEIIPSERARNTENIPTRYVKDAHKKHMRKGRRLESPQSELKSCGEISRMKRKCHKENIPEKIGRISKDT